VEPSYQCARYLGRAIWRRWSGHHRRSREQSKMLCVKLMRQSLMARDFDRQVATTQIRIAGLTRCCERGKPVAAPTGTVCLGQGAIQPSTDLCSKLHRRESPSACVARSPCCGAENPAAIAGFVDSYQICRCANRAGFRRACQQEQARDDRCGTDVFQRPQDLYDSRRRGRAGTDIGGH